MFNSIYYVINGVIYQYVDDVSVVIFTKEDKKIHKWMMMMGGCFAISLDKTASENVKADIVSLADKPDSYDAMVILLKSVFDDLTHPEQEAILAHEGAHVKNGDVFCDPENKTLKIKVEYDSERKADQAAIAAVGPEAMLSAIQKLTVTSVSYLLKSKKDSMVVKFFSKYVMHKVTKLRIKALTADIAAL